MRNNFALIVLILVFPVALGTQAIAEDGWVKDAPGEFTTGFDQNVMDPIGKWLWVVQTSKESSGTNGAKIKLKVIAGAWSPTQVNDLIDRNVGYVVYQSWQYHYADPPPNPALHPTSKYSGVAKASASAYASCYRQDLDGDPQGRVFASASGGAYNLPGFSYDGNEGIASDGEGADTNNPDPLSTPYFRYQSRPMIDEDPDLTESASWETDRTDVDVEGWNCTTTVHVGMIGTAKMDATLEANAEIELKGMILDETVIP